MRMINAIRHIAYYGSPSCEMWYQRVIEMNPPESASTTVQDTQPSTSSSRKRQWVDDEGLDDSPGQFRRVRLRHIPIQYTPMQNGNIGHGMPNEGSPAQHLQQPRSPRQYPNQQPQSQNRSGFSQPQTQLTAFIQTFYTKAMRELAQRHGNPAAITPQESQKAKYTAICRGTAQFKQQQQQQQRIMQAQALVQRTKRQTNVRVRR